MKPTEETDMKPFVSLTALLAGAAILVPLWSSDAQAIDVKVRQAVKVQPKIAVKPKVKVAPKIAVKPKVKVKPRNVMKLRVKVAPKTMVKPKVKIAPKLAAKPKIKLAPKVAATPKFKPVPLPVRRPAAIPVPSAAPVQPVTRAAKTAAPKAAGRLGAIRDHSGARNAANAAEAARNLAGMKDLRDGATAELGLDMPRLGGNNVPSNQERLGGSPGRKGNGFGFGDDLGGGPDMPGLMNTHNSKTPHNPFAVTPENIANGLGGVAGQQTVRLPLRKEVDHSRDVFSTASNGQVGSSDRYKARPDGSTTLVHEEYDVLEGTSTRHHVEHDRDGNIIEDTGPQPIENDEPGVSATELRNPDHVGGNPDCWSIDCVVNPSAPQGLISKKLSKNQVLPAAPDHAGPNSAGGSPVVSQERLLSRYDNDMTTGSSPVPIDTKGACQDC